jgi:hypothetical protein
MLTVTTWPSTATIRSRSIEEALADLIAKREPPAHPCRSRVQRMIGVPEAEIAHRAVDEA